MLKCLLTYFALCSIHNHCPAARLCWHFWPFVLESVLIHPPMPTNPLQKRLPSFVLGPHPKRKFLNRDGTLNVIAIDPSLVCLIDHAAKCLDHLGTYIGIFYLIPRPECVQPALIRRPISKLIQATVPWYHLYFYSNVINSKGRKFNSYFHCNSTLT